MNIRETMTPRQRVTEALCHRQPDRMPIDLGMYTASGISAFAYWDLREYLGLNAEEEDVWISDSDEALMGLLGAQKKKAGIKGAQAES